MSNFFKQTIMEFASYKYGDIIFEIEYNYNSGDDMVWNYGDGTGYDGTPAQVDIRNIFLNDTDVIDILTDEFIDTIEVYILNSHI